MATRWPDTLIDIDGRTVWGRIHTVRDDATTDDVPGARAVTTESVITATADIRGFTPRAGQQVTDPEGTVWTITAVRPSDFRYGAGVAIDLQQNMLVLD